MARQQPLVESDLSDVLAETFLQGLTFFEETDSTNSQAISLLSSCAVVETPHLVYAESQISGRGRGSNQWWSHGGSLTFSVIVDFAKLGLPSTQQSLLPLLTATALLQTGQAVIPAGEFALKWPNDVYLAGRKLAGILIEVPSQPTQRSESQASCRAVIGIGLNVNNQFANAPSDLQAIGISLADVVGQDLNRIEILTTFLRKLERVLRLAATGESVLDLWPDYCLLTGKRVTLQVGLDEITGVCRGIASTGALLLETNHGSRTFLTGVVKSWS